MIKLQARNINEWGISEFRARYPLMSIVEQNGDGLLIHGPLKFRARSDGCEEIADSYQIRVEVPADFPRRLPQAFEIGGRIPDDFHKNQKKDLCLGAPIRLIMELGKEPTLVGFVERLLIPFLYNHAYFEKHGRLPLGELAHGGPGLVDEYKRLFRVQTAEACVAMLRLLGMNKRIANKKPCACGSGRRLGRCHNRRLNPLRKLQFRSYFNEQARMLEEQLKRKR
ncbi:hypothetical protein D6833_12425 [Candidatus Parcubacteria bacterium]|nr:MAG: hypothetical protein D6833_12425 [Candidatus Parcubacteria bacterium]